MNSFTKCEGKWDRQGFSKKLRKKDVRFVLNFYNRTNSLKLKERQADYA